MADSEAVQIVKAEPITAAQEARTAEEWVPRIEAMLSQLGAGEWADATATWGVTKVDTYAVNMLLWQRFRGDSEDDPGYRIVAHRTKLTNRSKDPKTGVVTPATHRLQVRLVRRGSMLEEERDRANTDQGGFAKSRYS